MHAVASLARAFQFDDPSPEASLFIFCKLGILITEKTIDVYPIHQYNNVYQKVRSLHQTLPSWICFSRNVTTTHMEKISELFS